MDIRPAKPSNHSFHAYRLKLVGKIYSEKTSQRWCDVIQLVTYLLLSGPDLTEKRTKSGEKHGA